MAAKRRAQELEKKAREEAKRIKLEEHNDNLSHVSIDSDGTLTPDDADRMDLDPIAPAEAAARASEQHKSKITDHTKLSVDDGDHMRLDPIPSTTTESRAIEQRKPVNYYEGISTAKQLSEPLDDFLNRLPPSSTPRSQGPWIWIANPYPADNTSQPESGDIGGFKQAGFKLLEEYQRQWKEKRAQNPSLPAGVITRKMKAERDNLEPAILALAREKRVVTGKWMFFPPVQDVDRIWRIVADATWAGKLGIASKVATYDEDEDPARATARLICVYTADFTDESDVTRVLLALCDLGLVDDGGKNNDEDPDPNRGVAKVIYYKCDAYTHLDLTSGNEFRLKASMYSSRDMLKKERQSRADGVSSFARSR